MYSIPAPAAYVSSHEFFSTRVESTLEGEKNCKVRLNGHGKLHVDVQMMKILKNFACNCGRPGSGPKLC